MKKPELFFDIEDVLSGEDFTNSGSRIIFELMRELIVENSDIELDYYVLVSKAEERGLKEFMSLTNNGELLEALELTKNSVNVKTLPNHISAIKLASIKRSLLGTLDVLKDDVEDFTGDAIELKNKVAIKGILKVGFEQVFKLLALRIKTGHALCFCYDKK